MNRSILLTGKSGGGWKSARRGLAGASGLLLVAAGLAACGDADGGSKASDEVVIGLIQPLTGTSALTGQAQAAGAKAVADAINASGGIKELGGAKIRLEMRDSQADPVVASRLVRELAQQGVSALVGPQLSAEVLANKTVLKQLGVPAFVASYDASVTEGNEDGMVFRVGAKSTGGAEATVAVLKSRIDSGEIKNIKKVGILTTSVPPGPGVVKAYEPLLQAMNLDTTKVEYDPSQVKDFAPIVANFKEAGVDVIMAFQFAGDAALFAKALGGQPWRPAGGVYTVGANSSTDSFRKANSKDAEGWVALTNGPPVDTDTFPQEARDIAASWPTKFPGSTIEGSTAIQGASAMAVAVDAIAAAKSTDPKKVAEAARALSFASPKESPYPYYMMAGGLKFDVKQDNTLQVIPFMQLKADGSGTIVYPKDLAGAVVAAPTP